MISIDEYWKKIENSKNYPNYFRDISNIDSQEFLNIFDKKNFNEMYKLIDNLYEGNFILIKNCFNQYFIDNLKLQLTEYSKNTKSSFHKMKEGCPNFHRIQDESTLNKYSINAIRHSFYFFRWNDDDFSLFSKFDPYWSSIKFLGGLDFDTFKNNTPKDKIVDRIQIVRYPNKTGFIEPHQHHPINQRLIISIYMSEQNQDFTNGGTYFVDKNENKINCENKINAGDVGIFYATMKHGVDSVTVDNSCNNYNDQDLSGRWWIGLYSPESDHNKDRHTSNPVKIEN